MSLYDFFFTCEPVTMERLIADGCDQALCTYACYKPLLLVVILVAISIVAGVYLQYGVEKRCEHEYKKTCTKCGKEK